MKHAGQHRSRGKRCRSCGGALSTTTVRRFGETAPIVLVLLGSFLLTRLIGLLILPLGAFLWTRTRRIETCEVCAPAPVRTAR